MDILFIGAIIIGMVLIFGAFIGCVLPALPGPPLAFLALFLLKIAEPTTFSTNFLITMFVITLIVFALDYVLPIFGAKLYKASKKGIWFSIIGMILGIFFFPPFGMILGLLLGAIIGELLSGKAKSEAVKIGVVSFLFSLLAIFIKISLVAVMAYYFTKAIIIYYV